MSILFEIIPKMNFVVGFQPTGLTFVDYKKSFKNPIFTAHLGMLHPWLGPGETHIACCAGTLAN